MSECGVQYSPVNSCGSAESLGTRALQAVRPLIQSLGVKHGFACATPRQPAIMAGTPEACQ